MNQYTDLQLSGARAYARLLGWPDLTDAQAAAFADFYFQVEREMGGDRVSSVEEARAHGLANGRKIFSAYKEFLASLTGRPKTEK
jgi:hypothetical protein